MSKIVEFLGPSGVGKSTTYNELVNLWEENDIWLPMEKGYFGIQMPKITWKTKFKKNLLRIPYPSPWKVDISYCEETLQDYIESNKDLLDLFWDALKTQKIHQKKNYDTRFKSVELIKSKILKTALIQKSDNNKFVVLEDGLLHNIGFFSKDGLTNTDDAFFELVLNIYLPDAIVYFEIEEKYLLNRIIKRKQKTFLEKGLSDNDLKYKIKNDLSFNAKKIDALKKIKVPHLVLNSNLPPKVKANQIKDFLQNLEKK